EPDHDRIGFDVRHADRRAPILFDHGADGVLLGGGHRRVVDQRRLLTDGGLGRCWLRLGLGLPFGIRCSLLLCQNVQQRVHRVLLIVLLRLRLVLGFLVGLVRLLLVFLLRLDRLGVVGDHRGLLLGGGRRRGRGRHHRRRRLRRFGFL